MRLDRLELTNYRIHGNLQVPFGKGMTVLLGANGKGKSSLLSGLLFALTGAGYSEKGKSRLLKWGETAGNVRLAFTVGDHEYVVGRDLVSDKCLLKSPDCDLKKTTDVNAEIAKLLGADRSLLMMSAFMPQSSAMRLLSGKDADRQREFGRLFKLDELARVHSKLGETLTSIPRVDFDEMKFKGMQSKLDGLKDAALVCKLEIDDHRRWLADHKDLAMPPCDGDPDERYTSLTVNIGKAPEELTPVMLELRLKLRTLVDRTRAWETLKEVFDKLSSVDHGDAVSIKALLDDVLNKNMVASIIAKMFFPADCPICGTHMTEAPASLSTSAHDVKSLQAEYLTACSFEKKLADLKRDMDFAEEAMSSTISEAELLIKEHGLTEIPSLESLDKAYNARKLWESAKARQPNIDHQLLSALEQWHKLPTAVKQDRLDKRSRTRALLSLEAAMDTEAKRMEDLASDIESAKAIKEYSALCSTQAEMVSSIREHFKYDGIPAMVCKHYAAALSDAVNRYLPMFDAAYTISIGDKLDTVCHFGKHAVQVEDLSGGQEVVLGICVRLAIMEIAADSVPFIVMDEPTPHLDKSRRAAMVSVFEKVAASAKTFGRQFIVSTHEDELASIADYTIEL